MRRDVLPRPASTDGMSIPTRTNPRGNQYEYNCAPNTPAFAEALQSSLDPAVSRLGGGARAQPPVGSALRPMYRRQLRRQQIELQPPPRCRRALLIVIAARCSQ